MTNFLFFFFQKMHLRRIWLLVPDLVLHVNNFQSHCFLKGGRLSYFVKISSSVFQVFDGSKAVKFSQKV